jgi:hypothetical protein
MNQLLKLHPEIVITLFSVLFVMVFGWFGLLMWYFHRLRKWHPAAYEAAGSPSLFWNNSMRSNWLFFKFLFSSRPRELGDLTILRGAWILRLYFCTYLLLFLVMMTLPLTADLFLTLSPAPHL